MRLLSAFQSIFASASRGVAVAHVVQVDLWEASRRGQLLEPSRDRVRVRTPAILPAEQHAVIEVVRPEFAPLLVELLDVHLQGGERERVERQDVLSVLGLAVRLDHPAVDNDPRSLYGERSGVQVKQVTPSARQLAAPHARGGFEYRQRKEPVRPCALQKSLKLGGPTCLGMVS
jgi:hypothetical protein